MTWHEEQRLAAAEDGATAAWFGRVQRESVAVEPRPVPDDGESLTAELLEVRSIADVARRVDAAPLIGWLIATIWPGDAFGVIAALKKDGKTWLVIDMAVSVASGTPWLGRFAVDTPGQVLMFLGEGGERKMLRRLRAVASGRGLDIEDLPIRLSFRVPQLSSATHLAAVATELAAHPAALVIVDPLYLAAGGASGSDLYAMGSMLTGIQQLCQAHGSALALVTHYNKGGSGNGAHRMTGVGPAEWGRVLVSFAVEHRRTEPDRSTIVDLRLLVEGDEIPDLELSVRRTVSADNPDDLASPLRYTVETIDVATTPPAPRDGLRPAERRVLAILHDTQNTPLDVRTIGDRLAQDGTGPPLQRRTIQAALKTLEHPPVSRTGLVR